MKKNIQDSLAQIIKTALGDLNLTEVSGEDLSRTCAQVRDLCLDLPIDSRFGDLTTNIALRLSKLIQKSPLETANAIASRIKEYLEKSALKDYVLEVKAEGAGFLNFYLSNNYFYEELQNLICRPKRALRLNLGRGRKVLIEFVSANPTGPLSVAHARQAAVGDVLANILDFCGFRIKREYYLNDEGNQIDILGESVGLRIRQLRGEKIEFPQNYYQGDYIYDIARKIKNQKSKIKNFSEYSVKYILNIIKKELADFGVKFDYWRSQKELRKSGKIERDLDYLKKKGFLYEQDGAFWFKSTAFSDDKDRVVIKSDGSYTYLAPDIAYHREKYRRGFQWLINLWGPDHHGYIGRLKAAVQALGHPRDSLSIIIVQLATIFREGKPIQMSTRKGQYITLREVLDEVGLDAARFFFLMRHTCSHLDFDLGLAKKHTPENPVYYVQYAHARICSILRNGEISACRRDASQKYNIRHSPTKINFKKADLTLLKEKEEMGLIKKILQFSYILNICVQSEDPYMLTVYLQELAQSFHKFYDLHRVLGEDEKLTQARLALIQATRIVISTGLDLLGISRPEKM